jgi:hypothetical protein
MDLNIHVIFLNFTKNATFQKSPKTPQIPQWPTKIAKFGGKSPNLATLSVVVPQYQISPKQRPKKLLTWDVQGHFLNIKI